MKVLKSINNNVVSCLDENGQEVIAMGRGLGFSLRSGDELDAAKVEKLFRMQTPDEARRLSRSSCAAALWTGRPKIWAASSAPAFI